MSRQTPSVLALSRQGTPTLREGKAGENKVMKGGYVLREASGKRDATLIATGTELAIACDAAALLKEQYALHVAVVSMPCWELFDAQDAEYRAAVLGDAPRIAVEAGIGFGWERYTGAEGAFVGMNSFGESAPGPALYEHFGITAPAIAATVVSTIQS